MNDIFADVSDVFVIVYLDDILIFSDDMKSHKKHVRLVLQRLRDNNLFAKLKKCTFHTDTIDYLGFVISPKGIHMDPAKTRVIHEWPPPRTMREVQSFLGFANFYRRFIENYSKVAYPLTILTRKDKPFQWTDKAQSAFDNLKTAFTTAPVLAHYNPEFPCVVETDASDYSLGGILSQFNPETSELHPIAFHSRTLNPPERNYPIYEKELLAIVDSLKHWRQYLEGSPEQILILTDHQGLEYFETKRVLTRRQVRWSEILSQYYFRIEYREGRLSVKPDALTRRRDVYPSSDTSFSDANPQNTIRLFNPGQLLANVILDSALISSQISEGLLSDDTACQRIAAIRLDMDPDDDETPAYTLSDSGLLLYNGLIYVPDYKDLRLLITRIHHDHELAGHPGVAKTISAIKRRYWWPGLAPFIKNYIASCSDCKQAKMACHKPYGAYRFLPIPDRPWNSISMDFIEGLPESDGFNAILVAVDRLTKYAHFIPTYKDIDTPTLAILFLREIFSKHGLPADIVSDRGRHFTSRFWKSLCDLLKVQSNLSTAYHPETDGQTERVNQSLEQYLRIYINYQQDNWSNLLPVAEFAYNNATHSATGVSPFFATLGYHPRLETTMEAVPSQEAHQMAEDLNDLHEHLRDKIRTTITQYSASTEHRRAPIPPLEPGDYCWLDTRNIKTKRPMKKLDHKRFGPIKILEKISTHARRLDLPKQLRSLHPVFHVSLLEPHTPNSIPNRIQSPPPPVKIDGDIEFEVAEIVDSKIDRRRKDDGGVVYRVRWKGLHGHEHEYTTEPAANLTNARELLDEFHTLYPNKPRPPHN